MRKATQYITQGVIKWRIVKPTIAFGRVRVFTRFLQIDDLFITQAIHTYTHPLIVRSINYSLHEIL